LTECNAENFAKEDRGKNVTEAILQRLDRLTTDECLATAAQTLEVVYSLVRHSKEIMDGEFYPSHSSSLLLNVHVPDADRNESAAIVSRALGMQDGW
jgi:hypothetical protein